MKIDPNAMADAMVAYLKCDANDGDDSACVAAAIASLPEPPVATVAIGEHVADMVSDDVVSRLVPRLETLAQALSELLDKTVFTDEDVRLIREHVRPKDAPAAVEVAVLAERIRCALVCDKYGASTMVERILGGEAP